ncbi:hypothetical protein BN1051_00893 [Arthrobacter saudimassiliensis]|uniref:Uncharacterized protein n=1 Tax=Arthrobacter saudimassiliensis TaxID=1461584 RepID=A0A078MQB5_9MICC|nr:hypothetical protein BN1051_00893 [Arthrobacter saudimassiliensis]
MGVQQRPFYHRARTVLTWISAIWLAAAVLGIGFFSGGTTNLALSLALLYGTGMALVVVIFALYRWLSGSARRRNAAVPDDAAAAAFVDATRLAQEELWAALLPPRPVGLPGVRTAVTTEEARRALATARKSAAAAPRSAVESEAPVAPAAASAVVPAQAAAAERPAAATPNTEVEGTRPVKSAVSKKAVKKSGKKTARKRPASAPGAAKRPASAPGSGGAKRPAAAKPSSGNASATASARPGQAKPGTGNQAGAKNGSAATGPGKTAASAARDTGRSVPAATLRTRELLTGNGRGHLTLTPPVGGGPTSPSPRAPRRDETVRRGSERKAS